MPKVEDLARTREWEAAKEMAIIPVPIIPLPAMRNPLSAAGACSYCHRIHYKDTCPGCGAPKECPTKAVK